MPPEEGDALYDAACAAGAAVPGSPFLEVGSYCGRSTVWLGAAARRSGTVVFAVDHHRGSEEN
ncbi:MAG: class I SAM-dependent methyltransferase, partial [Ilumatobacteraceae bacterium]